MKLPAIQFYPGDWRKDPGVQALDFFARGVWFEMICLMHESERRGVLLLNGAPMPVDALANLLGLTVDLLNQNLTKLITYGVASREPETGAIMCRRMVRDEEIRKIRSESGKLGGNPALLNQKSTKEVFLGKPKSNPFRAEDEVEDHSGVESAERRGDDWPDKILHAYPRTDAPMLCLQFIRQALDSGEDAALMWEQTRECAMHLNSAPGGHSNSKMPSARTFFSEGRWRQPEVLEKRASELQEITNGKNKPPVTMQLGPNSRPTMPL